MDLDDEELKETKIINGVIAGDEFVSKETIKKLLEETTEEYHKECAYNMLYNRAFELKGAKEILEKLLEE